MFWTRKHTRYVWPIFGLLIGVVLGGLCPHTPMHATATDRYEKFAVCTGFVDDGVEAIYFLDFLTGDLKASTLAKQPPYNFNAFFQRNIFKDLQVDPASKPEFLMVSGLADLRRIGGRQRISRAVVYVTEVRSGRCAAYAIPWDAQRHAAGQMAKGELVLMAVTQFRTVAVREQ